MVICILRCISFTYSSHQSDITWASRHLKTLAMLLFIQLLFHANIKENIKEPLHWPFVRKIHQWLANSTQNGTVMQKVFPCNDIIMWYIDTWWHVSIWWYVSISMQPYLLCWPQGGSSGALLVFVQNKLFQLVYSNALNQGIFISALFNSSLTRLNWRRHCRLQGYVLNVWKCLNSCSFIET